MKRRPPRAPTRAENWPSGPPPLRRGRAHEANGPAASAFAAALIGAGVGPALWVLPPRAPERPDPYGLAQFFDPGRLILAETGSDADVFWAMEEALRSGAAPVVVAESRKHAGLTQSRRLQLATEAGGGVGLLISSGADGLPKSTAAETRWRASPLPAWAQGGGPAWLWELQKNKRGPAGAWSVRLGPGGLSATPASKTTRDATDPLALAAASRRRARPAA